MEYKGILQRWNDEKGFGFIASENKGQNDVFLHISELKNMSRRPVEGDVIFYQLYTDSNAKTKAINARIEAALFVKPVKKYAPRQIQEKNSFLGRVIGIVFVVVVIWGTYGKFKNQDPAIAQNNVTDTYQSSPQALVVKTNDAVNPSSYKSSAQSTKNDESNYHCDGRKYCSQITSCEEAMFFLKNCPDTKMDGDYGNGKGDGIPCEDEWCGH